MPAGLYASYEDYPDEGLYGPIDAKPKPPEIEGLTDGHSFRVQTAPTNTPGDDAVTSGGGA